VAGRVVQVATPLRLDFSSDLAGGAEEVVVVARAVNLHAATEATLRVAVASIDLQTAGDIGFVVEALPVYLGANDAQDVVGDPVASITIKEVAAGTLMLDAFAAGFTGPVQVRVRCGQPTSGRMSLRAYVDVVLKWSPSLDHGRQRVESSRRRVTEELDATRRRLAYLRRELGDRDWIRVAETNTLAALSDVAARRVGDDGCGCRGGLPGSSTYVDAVVRSDQSDRAPPPLADRPGQSRADCQPGLCCERIVLALPDRAGVLQSVDAEVCYPSAIDPGAAHPLVLITHGSPDGNADADFDWFDPPFPSGTFRSLQHDLARKGMISAFIAQLTGYEDRASYLIHAIGAMKLWITARSAEEPTSPLVNVDPDALIIAFVGHSDGGHAATLAASADYGVAVRACVNLAAPAPSEANATVLHSGTYYMQLIGTHDGSPSVTVDRGIEAFEQISTDRPRVLVLVIGANHGHLGPGVGTQVNSPAPYAAETTLSFGAALAVRSFLVSTFLQWALLANSVNAQKFFVDGATLWSFSDDGEGASIAGLVGPKFTPCLMRVPPAAVPWNSLFTALELFDGGDGFDAVSDNITSAESRQLDSPEPASGIAVSDCAGGEVDAAAPRSLHLGPAAFVGWDFFSGGLDSDAVIRIPLSVAFGELLGPFQTKEHFSLVCELGMNTNNALNLIDRDRNWGEPLWPALGLGDASGPQAWIRPQPVLNSWSLQCPLLFTTGVGTMIDASQTTMTSIAARLSLLVPGDLASVTHAYVDPNWFFYPRGECVLRAVRLLFHG
jgi:hypothetical protein